MKLLSRESLLIVHVEDDNDFAALTEIFLRSFGFEQPVVRCKDGADALHYFSTIGPSRPPHLILLDLHMPHLNGLEVLHWLRHGLTFRDLPIFLLTSSDEPEDRRRAATDKVTGYLLKAPLFDEMVRSLDQQIAAINHARFHPQHAEQDSAPFLFAGEGLPVDAEDAVSHSSF